MRLNELCILVILLVISKATTCGIHCESCKSNLTCYQCNKYAHPVSRTSCECDHGYTGLSITSCFSNFLLAVIIGVPSFICICCICCCIRKARRYNYRCEPDEPLIVVHPGSQHGINSSQKRESINGKSNQYLKPAFQQNSPRITTSQQIRLSQEYQPRPKSNNFNDAQALNPYQMNHPRYQYPENSIIIQDQVQNNNLRQTLLQNNLCGLCMEKGTNYVTICNHAFHKVCLQNWFRSHKTCPFCDALLLL